MKGRSGLDAFLEIAATVEVGGVEVKLRHPPPEVRLDLKVRYNECLAESNKIHFTALYNAIVAEALQATVVDHDHIDAEGWGKVVVAANEPSNDELFKLSRAALRISTFNVGLPEGVTDHAAVLDEEGGEVPT